MPLSALESSFKEWPSRATSPSPFSIARTEKSPFVMATAASFILFSGFVSPRDPKYATGTIISATKSMASGSDEVRLPQPVLSSSIGFTRNTAPIIAPSLAVIGSPTTTPALLPPIITTALTSLPASTPARYGAIMLVFASSWSFVMLPKSVPSAV